MSVDSKGKAPVVSLEKFRREKDKAAQDTFKKMTEAKFLQEMRARGEVTTADEMYRSEILNDIESLERETNERKKSSILGNILLMVGEYNNLQLAEGGAKNKAKTIKRIQYSHDGHRRIMILVQLPDGRLEFKEQGLSTIPQEPT